MQIEIPDELAAAAAEIADKAGQDVESLIAEMVTEAIKMRRVPTIHFEDGATGRRACVPGTGIPI
jgi:ribosome-binding factor A